MAAKPKTFECTTPEAWEELVRTERHASRQHIAERDALIDELNWYRAAYGPRPAESDEA